MKNNTFTDSALLIATITASLFIIGYLHEAPFLEKFGLNNEEFIPSSTKLILCGFKYLFINLINYMVLLGAIFMFFSITSLLFKDIILKWIKDKLKSDEVIKIRTLIIYSLISTIPFLTAAASIRVIKDGGENFQNYLNLKSNSQIEILYTKKYPKGIKGQVIRIHENKIAFFDMDEKQAKIFPDSEIIELKYFKNMRRK